MHKCVLCMCQYLFINTVFVWKVPTFDLSFLHLLEALHKDPLTLRQRPTVAQHCRLNDVLVGLKERHDTQLNTFENKQTCTHPDRHRYIQTHTYR